MTQPVPSNPIPRRHATCFLCPRPARQVAATAAAVDLDRDGRLYACERHPLIVLELRPESALLRCSEGFCQSPPIRAIGCRTAYTRAPVVYCCAVHDLTVSDLVPLELR